MARLLRHRCAGQYALQEPTMSDMLIAKMPIEFGVPPQHVGAGQGMAPAGVCMDEEIDDLEALLLEHATYPGVLSRYLARALAVASMGPNHLWEDLGLGSREQLHALMQEHFSALKALNSGHMRWKKFFYRMLCERAEIMICKSPHCSQCEDQPKCFE
jgi:hypothetical protein